MALVLEVMVLLHHMVRRWIVVVQVCEILQATSLLGSSQLYVPMTNDKYLHTYPNSHSH